jgi:hypothetical protein
VEEKDAWEVEWGRLVDWVGDQEEACLQLIGLEARLRAMYECSCKSYLLNKLTCMSGY